LGKVFIALVTPSQIAIELAGFRPVDGAWRFRCL
jgi:hypothetical protein